MITKHTAGPWEVRKNCTTVLCGDTNICDCAVSFNLRGKYEEKQANARLIAAAPDMLEALKEISRLPTAWGYPDGPCLDSEDMKMVLAAIAKAEGDP